MINRRQFVKRGSLLVPATMIGAGVLWPRRAMASSPVPSGYRPAQGDWVNYCGVDGGIPSDSWTRSGSVISAYSGSPGTITTALNAAADNTYVELGAGTFSLNDGFFIGNPRVELRGQVDANGQPTTILNFSTANSTADAYIYIRSGTGCDLSPTSSQFSSRNITSPAAASLRGVSTITLASAPTGLAVGQMLYVSSAQVFYGDTGSDDFLGREHCQIVEVTNITGSDVTFSPAINADYLTGTIAVYWRVTNTEVQYIGLRNLKLTDSDGSGFVRADGSNNCWMINVTTEDSSTVNHVYLYGSRRFEIRRCNMSGISGNSNSNYCIKQIQCSQTLIIDNYFHNVPNVMPMFGTSGSAFVFNYITDLAYVDPNWLSQIVFFHGGHNAYNLFEGNWCPASHNDNYSAMGSMNNVYFRERRRGWDATPSPNGKTDNCKCFALDSRNTNTCISGCVLGEDSFTTAYESTTDIQATAKIYYRHTSISGLIRKGNYNTVDDAIPASEALGADTLENSLIYSGTPSWWPSGMTFPPIDPANYSHSNDPDGLPAGYRAIHGTDFGGSGGSGSTSAPGKQFRGINLRPFRK